MSLYVPVTVKFIDVPVIKESVMAEILIETNVAGVETLPPPPPPPQLMSSNTNASNISRLVIVALTLSALTIAPLNIPLSLIPAIARRVIM